jgi:hypothetical protein
MRSNGDVLSRLKVGDLIILCEATEYFGDLSFGDLFAHATMELEAVVMHFGLGDRS